MNMSEKDHQIPVKKLRQSKPVVLPSMLLCDFGNLAREVELLEEAGVEALHLDVMDGVFVPNMTYGMPIVEAIRKRTQMPVDVHLMIESPAKYAKAFVDAGADLITFHVETLKSPGDAELLETIRSMGCAAGLAINPSTPMEKLLPFVYLCDLVLIMSVEAGFGGQAFNPVALERLAKLRTDFGPDLLLEVDGGVNVETAGKCVAAGADLLVVGSAIFKQPDYCQALAHLHQSISNVSMDVTKAS
jgi:ribulose-phosphate 3-epimerase